MKGCVNPFSTSPSIRYGTGVSVVPVFDAGTAQVPGTGFITLSGGSFPGDHALRSRPSGKAPLDSVAPIT
jgi:hypothetical protein